MHEFKHVCAQKNLLTETIFLSTHNICFRLEGQIKMPVFRVTQPYPNLLVKPRFFSGFLGGKYNFMHFERLKCLSKCIRLYFFSGKRYSKKYVPTLPTIFRPVTRNTLIFLLGLNKKIKF